MFPALTFDCKLSSICERTNSQIFVNYNFSLSFYFVIIDPPIPTTLNCMSLM